MVALIQGILGVMYTTWASRYADLESFSAVVSDFEIHNSWQLGLRSVGDKLEFELPTVNGGAYSILRSTELAKWGTWTNFTATAAIARCSDAGPGGQSTHYYRAQTLP